MANFFDTEGQVASAPGNPGRNFFDNTDATVPTPALRMGGSSMGMDALKSIPHGVVEGMSNILPAYGQAAAAEMAQPEMVMPTPQETFGALEKNVTGPLHKPETVLGEYTNKAGSFLPYMMAGPPMPATTLGKAPLSWAGGALSRIGSEAILPAIGSETGRQATLDAKGQPTSATPWAELAGGVLAPNIRATVAAKPTAEHQAFTDYLVSKGIKPTAGDQAGMGFARWAEQNAPDLPFVGAMGQRLNNARDAQFTQELMRRSGATDLAAGDRAMPEQVGALRNNLSANYDYLATRNNMNHDGKLIEDMNNASQTYMKETGKDVPPIISSTMDRIIDTKDQGFISGAEYQNRRHELGMMADRAERSGKNAEAFAMNQTRRALDDAWGRSISPQDQALWKQTNEQYGNLKNLQASVAGPGEKVAEGLASPEKYRTAIEKWEGKSNYTSGESENAKLARASTILNRLPQSGTGPRTTATILASIAGAGSLGALHSPMVGSMASGFMIAPSMVGHALLSRPGQALMSPLNQPTPSYLLPYYARALMQQQNQAGQ